MYCILKDRRTFRSLTDTTCSVTNYELTTESIYDEISDLRVTAAKVKPKEGDIILLENGFAGIVQEAEGNTHALDLRCRQMVTIFDRDKMCIRDRFSILQNRRSRRWQNRTVPLGERRQRKNEAAQKSEMSALRVHHADRKK